MAETALRFSRETGTIVPSMNMSLMFESFGLDDGTILERAIESLLVTLGLSTTSTFSSLRRMTGKHFVVCATNLHSRQPVYFSAETAPDLELREALYMSMTVPFVFKPRRYRGDLYVDGAMSANVPLDAFPGQTPLLLFLAFGEPNAVDGVRDFAAAVVSCTLSVQRHLVQRYAAEHASKVHVFHGASNEGSVISLDADEEYLKAQRQHGYAVGTSIAHEVLSTCGPRLPSSEDWYRSNCALSSAGQRIFGCDSAA